jgi:hypothetical protein
VPGDTALAEEETYLACIPNVRSANTMERLCAIRMLPTLALVVSIGLSMTAPLADDEVPVATELAASRGADPQQVVVNPQLQPPAESDCATCVDQNQIGDSSDPDAADAPAANYLRLTLSRSQ